ncbi:protein kinase [Undibacterium sp.]|uniref:protein kinase domain-containing protein n=1 Tax=Undibacterium sp. TaxID=1914977 RepID=UPI0025F85AB1|nr:protein kinase [Undibacterium sp.]
MTLVIKKKEQLQQVSLDVVLGAQLGAGGNGVVYAGIHNKLGAVAVKFMLNNDKKRYGRFCDEVKVVTGLLKGSPRVLPILEFFLTDPKIGVPYYIMPTALPIAKVLVTGSWNKKLLALAALAEGLAEIHNQNVAHRDIKPENLFFYDNTYRYGDFGIASFPERIGLTEKNEPIGPWAYMAIEMLSNPTTADPYKADIYSLAKTAWAIITEEKVPFAGQYSSTGRECLSTLSEAKNFVIEPLESLLSRSTDSNPLSRPTASEFAKCLRHAIYLQSDFQSGNTAQWAAAELDALSTPGVISARWETVDYIAKALEVLSRRDGLNHFFFPEGGGQQISKVSVCENRNMLSLQISYGAWVILKPRQLTLERFIGKPEFGYAVLETMAVEPLGVAKKYTTGHAELLRQVGDCDYLVDDSDDYESANGRVGQACERRFKAGTFIFAPTSGFYNKIDDYMGTAQGLGLEELRKLFQSYFAKFSTTPKIADMQLVPFTRLLKHSGPPRSEMVLEHIEMSLLRELIQLDDALVVEQREDKNNTLASIFDAVLAGPTPMEVVGQRLFSTMKPEQIAECLALLNIGRNVTAPEELKENTMINVKSNFNVDYVLSKFGNSFLRKSIARFGLSIEMPQVN